MLDHLFHKPDQWHEFRKGGITGTDARKIMAGDAQSVYENKLGLKQEDDLTDVFMVALGLFTEPLNVAWFEKRTGLEVSISGNDYLVRPNFDWWRMDIDGFTSDGGIVECKHSNSYKNIEDHVVYYYAQVQWYLGGLGRPHAYLSVIPGNGEPLVQRIDRDDDYISKLEAAASEVWECIKSKTPPRVEEIKPDIKFDDMREVDLTGNNQWADFAADFLENQEASKKFEASKKGLKSLVEDDVKRAFGHGVEIKRSKSNSLTVKGL